MDKDKIDSVLEEFLKEQELEAERQKKREEEAIKKEKTKKIIDRAKVITVMLLVSVVLLLNPYSIRLYKDYKEVQRPKEEYTISYNYSQGMEVKPFGENILIYDSSNLRLLKPGGEEIFNVNLVLDSWELEVSDKNIYLLDKVSKELYFISSKGEFENNIELGNIPSKIIAGKSGSVAVYYKTDVGIEGALFFDSKGKQIADLNYPKVSITTIKINEQNQFTVHGIYRLEPRLTNNMYHYSSNGKLIYSSEVQDAIIIDQLEMKDRVMLVDINNLIMLKKNSNEEMFRISSTIPFKSVKQYQDKIYALDKRNKMTIIDSEGKILDEKYYQTEFSDITWLNSELVFYSRDFVKNLETQLKFTKPIEKVFNVGNYIGIVMKGEVKLINKIS
ncbi:MAG: DUF5711 family protein [Proteocatella sp.]